MRCRRRAHFVEAECFDGTLTSARRVKALGGEAVLLDHAPTGGVTVGVETPATSCSLLPGDWLTKDNLGGVEAVRAAEFRELYEALEEAA